MSIAIRRVTPDDAALFERVAPDVFDHEIVPARLAVYLASPQNLMILALDGDLVVGQCAAVVHTHPDQPTSLYVDNLGVEPDYHRRGIGSQLVRAMFDWGRELGCEVSWVLTEPDNAPARALYETFKGDEVEMSAYYTFDL